MQTAFRSEEQFTQEKFVEWLEELPSSDINHYELLGGRIVMTPPAGYPHSPIAVRIIVPLQQHVRAGKLGMVCDSSAGYELPSGDTVEPDVSFISAARIAAGPSPVMGKFFRIVPDIVVEILSPATARRDREEKKAIYESNGVLEYWIVDTRRREVVAFDREGSAFGEARRIASSVAASSVLPGLTISLSDLFDDLP